MDDQNLWWQTRWILTVVPRVQFMKIYRQLGRRAVVIKKILKPLGGGHAPVLNVFIIPRGLPERKKNFGRRGGTGRPHKIKYGIQYALKS